MTNEDRGAARRALSDTLPVVAGYIVLGAGFGVRCGPWPWGSSSTPAPCSSWTSN